MNINIDTEKLNAQIDKLEKIKSDIQNTFQTINKETNDMKNYYESGTAEGVQEEFSRFNRAADDYVEDLDAYINYLKNVVNQSYIDYEKKENKLIDENIATN